MVTNPFFKKACVPCKAGMGHSPSSANPNLANPCGLRQASIWLQNNRNFQKYDINGDGVIEEVDLIEAMAVFMGEHWKFDGVLWAAE